MNDAGGVDDHVIANNFVSSSILAHFTCARPHIKATNHSFQDHVSAFSTYSTIQVWVFDQ